MIDGLIQILRSKKLNIEVEESTSDSFILTFEVKAKPGSKVEKAFVSKEGFLVIQTRSKPIDGEANMAIIEAISNLFGNSKSQIEIFRGDKSKSKKIRMKTSFTINKKAPFFKKKFNAISVQEALD